MARSKSPARRLQLLPQPISTEPVSVGSQLARYTAHTPTDFHRACLGGITTGPLHRPHPNRFPPSLSRWDHNWPATPPTPQPISTELVSVGSQLARYTAHTPTDFHRACLGGITTGPLHRPHPNRFPPSLSRWDHNWPATPPTPQPISTELVSVGSQLARYTAHTPTDFHRACLGGITTGPLHRPHRNRFPPSLSRWDHNWPATSPTPQPISTEPVSVGSQLARYTAHTPTDFHRACLGGITTGPLHRGPTPHKSLRESKIRAWERT